MLPKNKSMPKKRRTHNGQPATDVPHQNGPSGPAPHPQHFQPHPVGNLPAHHGGLSGPKGGKGKKGHKGNGGAYYGGVGPYKGVRKHLLNQLVNGLLGQEMRDLKHQRGQVNNQYQRGLGDLNHIFGETGGYLNFLQGQNAAQYKQTGDQVSAANTALQGQLGQVYQGAQGNADAELARLGIVGGGNTAGISGDQANAQALAAISGANAQSTLGLASNNTAQMSGLLQGMNQGSYQQAVGQNLNNRNDAMAKIMDAVIDLKKSRKDVWLQLAQQLQQTGWDQFLQSQQLHLQKKSLHHHKKK